MVPEIVVGYRQDSRRHGVLGGKTLKLPSVRQASVKVVVYRERTYTAGGQARLALVKNCFFYGSGPYRSQMVGQANRGTPHFRNAPSHFRPKW